MINIIFILQYLICINVYLFICVYYNRTTSDWGNLDAYDEFKGIVEPYL